MEINKVYINEETYPRLLKEIQKPPDPLYYIGNLRLAERTCVAVVGSRRASGYGCGNAEALGKKLAARGASVVSGMAKGIDSCAHRGALSAKWQGSKGSTIAVLGCGIDVCYPPSNQKLRNEIAGSGLIVSEYPPGTQPARYMFPRRNRIISGLSVATVVVQAPGSSGALITAEMAAEQGRAVYAVPGNIDSAYNLGSNKLICDGAVPLVILEDLLTDLGLGTEAAKEFEKNLGEEELRLVEILAKEGEMTQEQLCVASGRPASLVSGMVTILEMKGVICMYLGKIFIAKS
ncbi:MAG: DNA-protecting protein DprA [Firmicutes bacterium]|jgi:DNA processing protein|nr:DNA-protecting protein DprA [Bacillota bacterium]